MTKREFDKKQHENIIKLLEGSKPKTQIEKDIWNLKYMRYSINHGSFLFRIGCIKTLDRAIEALSSSVNQSETNSYGDPGTFRICRTSDNEGHEKPCPNARFVKRDKADEWSTRKINYWEVKLDSLEDLMHLIEETGNALVIFGADEKDGPMIEIYDDYRE